MNKKYASPIIMIAAGMKNNKKDFINKKIENMYLNYGLLGLASVLASKGYKNIKMFQGDHKKKEEFIKEMHFSGINFAAIEYPVFISVPSFFAIEWANEVIEILKIENKSLKFLVGGRWVIDNNLEWIKRKMPSVNFFVKGCPDEVIENLLDENMWASYDEEEHRAMSVFNKFNYLLLNNYRNYQPSIEISRGCGRKCDFCLEKDYPLTPMKSAQDVVSEADEICRIYGKKDLNFYFQASMFNPTLKWAEEFQKNYKAKKLDFKWRFETRVDSADITALELLATAGLKVVDLGLESASKQQLKLMNKTNNPCEYLKNAEILLEKMDKVGIWAKLNILIYLGETKETLAETMEWLNSVKFKGVSVNPFILYLNGKNMDDILIKTKNMSGEEANIERLYQDGFTYVRLSPEISVSEVKKIAKKISDQYMSEEAYIDLKKICYLKI